MEFAHKKYLKAKLFHVILNDKFYKATPFISYTHDVIIILSKMKSVFNTVRNLPLTKTCEDLACNRKALSQLFRLEWDCR